MTESDVPRVPRLAVKARLDRKRAMLRRIAALTLFLVTLLATPLAADPADIAAAARSVVRVVLIAEGSDGVQLVGHGSGFVVAPGLVVTNAHVVAPLAEGEANRVGIVPSQGKTGYFAKVVAYSPANDLALVRLTEPGALVPAALFTGPVTDGEDVFAVGYPGNVDAAQGLESQDIMRPVTPVKTRGSVSAGRASKGGFDTILHTAPIGAGNSGGPLLDGCGRVIGANAFGTEAASGADSEFYFAVSMREIARFLSQNGVKAQLTGEPCRSQADFATSESARLAGERASAADAARSAAAKSAAALERATRTAQLEVISERENRMALAGLALLLAMGCGGAAFWLAQQEGRARDRKVATIAAAALVVGAIAAWLSRPEIDSIEDRAAELAATAAPTAAASSAAAAPAPEGALTCVFDAGRSRVTVSSTADVPIDWRADGCVNGRTQYGQANGGWTRVLVPGGEDTVTVARFDPASSSYRTDRYLLDAETMARARAERGKLTAPACGAGDDAVRAFSEAQARIEGMLPASPNERLSFNCQPSPGG